jgi:hypothetical protein
MENSYYILVCKAEHLNEAAVNERTILKSVLQK